MMKNWLNRAAELKTRKDWHGLITHCRYWTAADPEDAVAWYNLGDAYGKSGWTQRKIECYEKALSINPNNAKAWNGLGNSYRESGQYQLAIECYEKALSINPNNAKASTALMMISDKC